MKGSFQLVILGSDWDLYKLSYSDILNDKVRYVRGFKPHSKILQIAYKIHLTPKINKFIDLPFKTIWNKLFLKGLKNDSNVVFLVFQNWLSIDSTIHTIDYLKKHYKHGKVVLFLQDIVSSFIDIYKDSPIDIMRYKHKCDAIISFDKEEAKKYGFLYHPTVFSHISVPISNADKCDVFFIGKYKGRLDLLIEIYKKLSSYGLKCNFIVLKAPKEKQRNPNEIKYIDRILSYDEVLRLVSCSNCILEILQSGAVGYTYRLWETISYNKYLLTNNQSLSSCDFYDKEYISIFSSAKDIDMSFMNRIEKPYYETNPNFHKIGPNNLIKFIEQQLNIEIIL